MSEAGLAAGVLPLACLHGRAEAAAAKACSWQHCTYAGSQGVALSSHVGHVDVGEGRNGARVLPLADLRDGEEPSVLVRQHHHLGGVLREQARRAGPEGAKAAHHDQVVGVHALDVARHVVDPGLWSPSPWRELAGHDELTSDTHCLLAPVIRRRVLGREVPMLPRAHRGAGYA